MPENIYEIISLGARYWFAFLGVAIVWRAFRWLRKDRKAKHRRLRQLPDAGLIGEMVVLQGSDELPEGSAIPIPRAGVMGFIRSCDVVVPVDGVAARHVDFVFQDGKGLMIFPLYRQRCYVDDTELTHRSKSKHFPMCHGSRLQLGEAVLRLRLFAGLDAEYRAPVPYEPQLQPFYDEPEMPQPWQEPPYQQPAPWQDIPEEWQQDEPAYQAPPMEDSWLNPPPPQPPRRHSRAERRHYHE